MLHAFFSRETLPAILPRVDKECFESKGEKTEADVKCVKFQLHVPLSCRLDRSVAVLSQALLQGKGYPRLTCMRLDFHGVVT